MIKLVLLSSLDLYKSQGIDRIVALRGDLPSGQVGLGELPYAQDLVRLSVNIQATISILKLLRIQKCIRKLIALMVTFNVL